MNYGPYCPKCHSLLETIDGEWFNCPKRCDGCIGLVAEDCLYLQPARQPRPDPRGYIKRHQPTGSKHA